ncbi:hypothetical protein [Hyphomicrobium sp. 802]|uniref:hypothetical protein n=1 Tax=Hyphomicrobium sp. 802 TaxID=1112272 RepID=UPI00045E9E54|nr:hypothetical protein [Hyphomicrobium sp. 802]
MIPRPPFRSDEFALCYRAYTAALVDIQKQTVGFSRVGPADSTCLMVALRIIEASANGVRDLPGLKRRALFDMIVPN